MRGIVESSDRVRVTAGAGATAAAFTRFPRGDRPLVIRDAAVSHEGLALPRDAIDVPLEAAAVDSAMIGTLVAAGRGATSIVSLGGGSVMDAAKIVRMLLVTPQLTGPLQSLARRSGLVRVPELLVRRGPDLPLLLISTTFGTGTETSRVACLATSWGRRLLSGSRLQADGAVLDPVHTATLPRMLQGEGLMEVILRVLGPAAGSAPSLAADHDARGIVMAAAGLAEQLRAGRLSPEQRLFASQLSAATHRSWALVGRRTYAAPHWYLANELSWETGTRKIPATLAIVPAIWRRIIDGDTRWGAPERLAMCWTWIREAVPGLPEDANDGLIALRSRWGLQTISAPAPAVLDAVVERCLASWGAPLPALGRLDRDAVASIFAESFDGSAIRSRQGEEVMGR